MTPVITFLSDFGLTDPYTGICHAVIAAIAPTATVVDLTHTVPALDIGRGATALADCVTVAPAAVHLAVVDPDDVRRVGSFSDLAAGALGIVEDSFGWLAIVAGGADASLRLDLRSGDAIRLGDG